MENKCGLKGGLGVLVFTLESWQRIASGPSLTKESGYSRTALP